MKNKQHTLPSFFLISSAVDGNENAIEKLLLFYEAYISKCCLRPFYDEYGNVYIVVAVLFLAFFLEFVMRLPHYGPFVKIKTYVQLKNAVLKNAGSHSKTLSGDYLPL